MLEDPKWNEHFIEKGGYEAVEIHRHLRAGLVDLMARCEAKQEAIDGLDAELAALRQRAEAAEKERDEARKWAEETVAKVVAARVVTCVYCGHKYEDGTPQSQDERLTAHIKVCEKHPMRVVEAERDEAQESLERVGVFIDQEIAKIPTVLRGGNEALIYEHIRTLIEPRG